jgi:hypothetical protein
VAKLPAQRPAWADRQYRGYGSDWDRAVSQCREVLLSWARANRPGTYTELTQMVTAIPWPEGAFTHEGSQMGHLLGQVSLDELDADEDRPVMSALVYGTDENMPSYGSWSFLAELGAQRGAQEPHCRTRYVARNLP